MSRRVVAAGEEPRADTSGRRGATAVAGTAACPGRTGIMTIAETTDAPDLMVVDEAGLSFTKEPGLWPPAIAPGRALCVIRTAHERGGGPVKGRDAGTALAAFRPGPEPSALLKMLLPGPEARAASPRET